MRLASVRDKWEPWYYGKFPLKSLRECGPPSQTHRFRCYEWSYIVPRKRPEHGLGMTVTTICEMQKG